MDSDLWSEDADDFESALLEMKVDQSSPPTTPNEKPSIKRHLDISDPKELYKLDSVYAPTGYGQIGSFMANKRGKLKHQNNASVEDDLLNHRPQIFKGLAIYINGFTGDLTLIQLSNLLILHGGSYVSYLDRKSLVTHIVAANLTPSKRIEFKDYKVLVPAWLIDSVAAGKLLNYKLYLETPGVHKEQGGNTTLDSERLGTQTLQRGLFTMGGWSNKTSASKKGKEKEVIEEEEEELELPTPHQPTFISDSPSTSNTFASSPPPAVIQPPHLKPVTKPPAKLPQAEWDSYLPSKRVDRSCLNDPNWIALHTASHPDYLKTYLKNSRLHHLSCWKQDLILYAAKAQSECISPIIKRKGKKLFGTKEDERIIFHVDFDCFFVAVGLISRPELSGKCVAVCHAKGDMSEGGEESTSEISSCSYEARKFGVKSSMSLGRARELCPSIITIPFEFELYQSISKKFYDILLSFSDYLQAVSVDEVLMDVSSKFVDGDITPIELAEEIRKKVFEVTKCNISIGIGDNILLSKLASRIAKPNGVHYFNSLDSLATLNLTDLPGIGYSLADSANDYKITKVGDLLTAKKSLLIQIFGEKRTSTFLNYANGIDFNEVEIEKERKSVGCDINYGIRFQTNDQVEIFVKQIGEEVAKRLKLLSLTTRNITLSLFVRSATAPIEAPKFLGHGQVDKSSYSTAISTKGNKSTDDGKLIGEFAWKLLLKAEIDAKELRGIGIHSSKLESNGISVDQKLEIGQGKLAFTTVKPIEKVIVTKENVSKPIEKSLESKKRKVEIDLIISSDSDSPPTIKRSSTRIKAVVPPPPLKKVKKVKLAGIFQSTSSSSSSTPFTMPTADKISLEWLGWLDISESKWKESSKIGKERLLRLVSKSDIKNLRDYLQLESSEVKLPSKITKPFIAPMKLKPPAPLPAPLSTPPDSSPSTMSQSDLFKLDPTADWDFFRELPLKEQRIQIKRMHAQLDLKKSLKVQACHAMIKDSSLINIIQIEIMKPVQFHGFYLKEELRNQLALWLEDNEIGPSAKQLNEWKQYFIQISSIGSNDKQFNLKLLDDLLHWWKFLLEMKFGNELDENENGLDWFKALRDVKLYIRY